MTKLATHLASIVVIASSMLEVNAAIVVIAPTPTIVGSVHIVQDITFDINATGVLQTIVLNDWVAADQFKTSSNASPMFSLSLNGGPQQFYPAEFFDNIAGNFNDFTSGDGYFFLATGPNVLSGDTITVHAANYALEAVSDFNPEATQTFKGEAFLADNNGVRLSNSVTIPEPSSLLLCSLSVLSVLHRRR